MKLHAIKHDYRAKLWCGIAALATVTGRPTSECRAAIVEARGQQYGTPRVTGIYNSELRAAFALMGYRMIDSRSYLAAPMRERPTLARFLRERTPALRSEIMVVNVTGHYVTVSGRKFIDSHQREAVSISDAHCRRARVKCAWVLRKADAPVAWTPPVKPKRQPNTDRAKAIALAKEHGIEIDDSDYRSLGHIWVTCEKLEATGEDIHAGDHIASDWCEALERVTSYVEVLQS